MKRIFCLSVFLFLFILLVSGCGVSKVPNENELKEMLSAKYPECLQRYIYQDEVFEIDNFEILRRQTNKEEKTDKVDCKLTVHNEYYEGVFNYTLHLNYYDEGGWQLDGYEKLGDEEIKATKNTLPAEMKESEIDNYTNYYGNITFIEELFDIETGIVTRKYEVNNGFNYLTVSGDIVVEYELIKANRVENGYFWVPHYTNNVVQTWSLDTNYKFNAEPQEYSWQSDFNDQVPKIFGADGDGEDIAKGIAYIEVKNITSEEIEIVADIINRDYDGGFSFDSFSQKNITFNIKEHGYSQRVFSNRDGDYINLVLDTEKGIYVEEYSYDNNKKYYYDYIPY